MPSGLDSLDAVIVDAPLKVAAHERFEFVVELRNRSRTEVDLSPCPWFIADFGENAIVSFAVGRFPCDRVRTIAGGARLRLRVPIEAPAAVGGEGGQWAPLHWVVGGRVLASIALPMEGVRA